MNKCRGMLWKQRGLQNRVTCSCKIRGSRSHCIDLHNHACVLLGQKHDLMESQPHISRWRASNSLVGWWTKQQSLQCCNGRIWLKTLGCPKLDLTTAADFGLQSRLSYCEIHAATCFRLRGDNLNENPPLYHAYGRPKAGAQNSWSDLKQDTLKCQAGLDSIKVSTCWATDSESERKDYQNSRGGRGI